MVLVRLDVVVLVVRELRLGLVGIRVLGRAGVVLMPLDVRVILLELRRVILLELRLCVLLVRRRVSRGNRLQDADDEQNLPSCSSNLQEGLRFSPECGSQSGCGSTWRLFAASS